MTILPRTWSDTAANPDWLRHASGPVVWQVMLSDASDALESWLAPLPEAERQRALTYHREEDRLRHAIARRVLRRLTGLHLSLPPEQVRFEVTETGKPFLAPGQGGDDLHFNLSHSGKLILIAFHAKHPVGVDVEHVRPLRDWRPIAQREFSAEVVARLDALPEADHIPAFFQEWSRHEARVKALGVGLAGASRSTKQVTSHDLELPEGYAGAVGVVTSDFRQ